MTRKTWFITGVNSGLGRQMTEQLLARGDRVAGTVRKAGAMDDLQASHGDRLWLAHLDLTDGPGIRRVVDRAFAQLGRIDVIVNNAGYGLFGAVEELTEEQIEHVLATNLVGSIRVVRAALPHLRAQGGGRIIQVSSAAGQAVVPGLSLYHASKWGIEGFMESTRLDVAPFGIGVTLIEPGSARTDFASTSVRLGAKIAAYDASPAAATRRVIEAGSRIPPGDPAAMARAMIASADEGAAPKRIALGSDAYAMMHAALTERLAALEAQQALAASTDFHPMGRGASQV